MGLDLYTFRRVKDTPAQSRLGKQARRRNVRGAFVVTDPAKFAGKTVVLVDDVATTGSTLHECAVVLKKAGADAVLCLVFARTGVGLARAAAA
jgi:predicted amidophosphoribosyltransferase